MWKKCKEKDGPRELKGGLKASNVLSKGWNVKQTKYHFVG